MSKKVALLELILIVVSAIGVSFTFYRFGVCPNIIPTNDIHQLRFLNLYDFYDDIPKDSILFIGDSQVVEGVDAYIIKNTSNNIHEIFNLGLYGDAYAGRMLVINKILQIQPSTVFVALSPYVISNKNQTHLAYYKSIYFEVQHDETASDILNKNLPNPFLFDPLGKLFYFLFHTKSPRCVWRASNFRDSLNAHHQGISDLQYSENYPTNFKNPHPITDPAREIEKDPKILDLWIYDESVTAGRDLFITFINKLRKSNITVIVIDMPINPQLTENIPSDKLLAYQNFVNTSISPFYPYYSFSYNSSFFVDGIHLNNKGRENLSISIANILKEMQ